jgi:hypothetical protein
MIHISFSSPSFFFSIVKDDLSMIKYLSFHLHIRTTYHPRSINFFFSSLFVFNQCIFCLYAHWLVDVYTCIFKGKEKERKRKSFMITTNNHFSFNITVTYIYILACACIVRFFLLNICKTIITQEIDKQRASTSSPIGGINRQRGREREK